jgi:hypothetical protein
VRQGWLGRHCVPARRPLCCGGDNSGLHAPNYQRLVFGTSGLGLDNPCDGVNQLLVEPRDGENTAAGERRRGADRRSKPDTGREPEMRKPRKHGQLWSCGRREALTGGWGTSRGKGLAPQPKQRVYYAVETLAK